MGLVGLVWIRSDFVGLVGSLGLAWIGLDGFRMVWIRVGVVWIGLDWLGLVLGWIGMRLVLKPFANRFDAVFGWMGLAWLGRHDVESKSESWTRIHMFSCQHFGKSKWIWIAREHINVHERKQTTNVHINVSTRLE